MSQKNMCWSFFSTLIFLGIFGLSAQQAPNKQAVRPNDEQPVLIEAHLAKDDSYQANSMQLVVNIQIFDGWHIYAHVSDSGMFYETKLELNLPEGLKKVGEPVSPAMEADGEDMEMFVYKGDIQFRQPLAVDPKILNKQNPIKLMIGYSACNDYMCRAVQFFEKDLYVQ